MTAAVLDFGPLERARFVERPNRFLVRCHVRRRGIVTAFLPNPGRLWELLLPDAPLWITRTGGSAVDRAARKTRYTVLAVERDGAPVLLHTHLANRVARWLLESQRLPDLAGARIVRQEVPVGRSRFDFLLRWRQRDLYLEVKSCTLFGNGVAMFPDAVTERGRKHLLELAALASPRCRTAILFLVQTPKTQWFMPDYHTDLAFSQTLLDVRSKVRIIPVGLSWGRGLELDEPVTRLEVPWDYLREEVADRGSYLLLLHVPRPVRVGVGSLGEISLARGYYVYVGSAMQSLSQRIARHCRAQKKPHWHVDYLRPHADECLPLPIRSSRRDECEVAGRLSAVLASGPAGFGSSDCDCPTHLFSSQGSPLDNAAFHTLLHEFRMRPPDGTIIAKGAP